MGAPVIRPATRADIDAFSSMAGKPSIRAIAMELDGAIIGLGGIAFSKGRWIGFCDLKPEARRYRIAIARAAIRFMRQIEKDGVRFVYVGRDASEPRSLEWLMSLGFVPDPKSQILYRWSTGTK